jgi:hypothetical protein
MLLAKVSHSVGPLRVGAYSFSTEFSTTLLRSWSVEFIVAIGLSTIIHEIVALT